MSDAKKKDGAEVRFPPPLLPLATIVGGILLTKLVPLTDSFNLPTPGRYWVGGLIVAASLVVLGLLPVVNFRRSGQSPVPWAPTPEIIVEGVFRFTRNPMYLQMVLTCIGFGILLSDAWILVLTPLCVIALYQYAIKPEEAYLEGKFGESYTAYKKRVGAGSS